VSLTRIECQILGQAQAISQGQTLTVEIVPNPPPKQITRRNTSRRERPTATPPFSMKLRPRLPTRKPTRPRARGSAPTHTPRRGGCTNQSGAAINLMQNPNAKQNLNSRPDIAATPIHNAYHNHDQNPNAGLNQSTRGSRHPGRNSSRQQPSTGQAKESMQALEVEQYPSGRTR